MSAEIRRLSGENVDADAAAGDPAVVEELERMLECARAGRLVAFHAVCRIDGHIGTMSRGLWPGQFFESIGALAILQHDMIVGSHLHGDPLDDAG